MVFRLDTQADLKEGVAHLVAKIPDAVSGGKGTTAKMAPLESMKSMQM